MDPKSPDSLKEYQRVLDPESRLKLVTKYGNTVDVDSNVPPRRYSFIFLLVNIYISIVLDLLY